MAREEFWNQATARHLIKLSILFNGSHAGGNAFGTVQRDHAWWIYQTNERGTAELDEHYDTEGAALTGLLKLLEDQVLLNEWRKGWFFA